jgi:hypothetical protein
MRGSFLSGSADGTLQHWNKSFQLVNTWAAHDGIVLASTTSAADHLLTGGNDGVVKIWDVSDDEPIAAGGPAQGFQGTLFHTLAKLVSFQTIADDEHREECRQGALYLKRVLRELGADTVLVSPLSHLWPIRADAALAAPRIAWPQPPGAGDIHRKQHTCLASSTEAGPLLRPLRCCACLRVSRWLVV